MEKDVRGTLDLVADMGYEWVETAFFPEGMSYTQAGQVCRDAGLRVASAHVELPHGEHKDTLLEAADAFACNRMVWHGWPEDAGYQTLDGIRRLADTYNEAHAFCQNNGLRLGLHNHWWEFQAIPESEAGRVEWQERFEEDLPPAWGGLPFFLLRPLLDPGIFFELDMYWTLYAGLIPADIVREFGAQAPLLHIKDGIVLSEAGPMVPVGSGMQDFPAIVEAGAQNIEWMIVELDSCECGELEAAQKSLHYLISNGLVEAY